MTIRQVYYTSCRQGIDGIQGFQVNAASAGLDRAQIDSGLQLSLYRPAPSAPPLPTPEQVDAFPVAVGYRSFGDYAVLFHSRYLGADYTGRQGNYFAHLLVLDAPDRDLAGMLPVQAWGASRWTWEPADGAELPTLPEVPRGRLDEWSVGGHLRAGQMPEFVALLGAVHDGLRRRAGRVVVVAPQAEDVARAIAAVTRSLPTALAAAVSFTTFTAAPGDADVLVVGTTPDVTIPSSPFGDQTVIRLGRGPGDDGEDGRGGDRISRYARVVQACWARGDDEVGELVAMAATITPPIEPAELDDFSYLIELVVPDSPAVAPTLLPALEFAVQRLPSVLRPRLWDRVDHHVLRGGPLEDVSRWSAVLTAAQQIGTRPPPGLEARYLTAALAGLTGGGLDRDSIWLPVPLQGPHEHTALLWADAALDTSPTFDTATAVLGTLGRVGLALPEPTLRHLVDRVILPQLIDPSTAAAAADQLEQLPATDRVLPVVCRQLEGRIGDDPLFDTVVEELPVAAAELLGPFAARGSRCALAISMIRARARTGDSGPVSVFVEAVRVQGGCTPDVVDRFVALLWPESELPTVTEAVALCRKVPADVLGATTVPQRLVGRLIADAEEPGLSPDDVDLAALLAAPPVLGALDGNRTVVTAIQLGAGFRSSQRYSDKAGRAAVDAVRAAADVTAPVRRWVLDAVAVWILRLPNASQHAQVLTDVLAAGRSPEFIDAYRKQLIVVLNTGRSPAAATVLPALAFVASWHGEARTLLDTTCATVLSGRRKRDLEAIGQALARNNKALKPMLREMGSQAPHSWPDWWVEWQQRHLRRSLLGRLIAWRRTKAAS